jgi:hypothetical protein
VRDYGTSKTVFKQSDELNPAAARHRADTRCLVGVKRCRYVYDAELLEVLPAEFRDEYEDRLRLNSHYETKFAEQR